MAPSQDPLANPDDLLSQLAGNEIDRLLAETHAETLLAESQLKAEAEAKAQLAKAAAEANRREAEEVRAAAEANTEAAAPANAPPAPSLDEQLDALLDEAVSDAPAPAKATSAKAASASEHANAKSDLLEDDVERAALLKAAGFEQPVDEIPGTTASDASEPGSERTALLHAAGFDSSESAADHAADDAEAFPDYIAPLPFFLRPLKWINSPVADSPKARKTVGAIAIVTLVNAIVVLTYVLVFRKH
jgi:hypothetical protein